MAQWGEPLLLLWGPEFWSQYPYQVASNPLWLQLQGITHSADLCRCLHTHVTHTHTPIKKKKPKKMIYQQGSICCFDSCVCSLCPETRETGTLATGVETSRDVISSAGLQLPSVTAGWLWTYHWNPIRPQFPSLKKVLLTTLFWKWIQIVLGSCVWSSGT